MAEDETRVILKREIPLEFAEVGDGRTLEARIVPYGELATICDPPKFEVEQERFAPGAFNQQLRAAHRVQVWLNFEHEQGLRGIVGHGADLEDREDGLYGSFRVHDNVDGNKALQLVREGLLSSLSAEFLALKSKRFPGGVVERVRAHLDRVSLIRRGAYAGAQVLAVRAEPDTYMIDAPRPIPMPDDLAAQLAERGFKLPGAEIEEAAEAEVAEDEAAEAGGNDD